MSQFAASSSVSGTEDQSLVPTSARRGAAFWIGWALSGLVGLAIFMGGVTDVLKLEFAVKGVQEAGYHEAVMVPLGVACLVSVILLMIPRTAMLGAILITAYLGGAVATHVIKREYGMMLAPVVFAVVMWIGLVLRDRRIRTAVFG